MQDSILNPRYLWIVYITAISLNAQRSQMYCTDAKKTKQRETKQNNTLHCLAITPFTQHLSHWKTLGLRRLHRSLPLKASRVFYGPHPNENQVQ